MSLVHQHRLAYATNARRASPSYWWEVFLLPRAVASSAFAPKESVKFVFASHVLERASFAPVDIASERPSTYLALVIVDAGARIKFSYWNGTEGNEIRSQLCEDETNFRSEYVTIVRGLASRANKSEVTSTVTLRNGGKSMRLAPLVGLEGTLFALVMEADRDDGVMTRAASRFKLTKRQTEVLALVLTGASASDVARTLMISEYTAQGYVKCLLAKTDSRNRAAMVAKVLDWKQPRPQQAELAIAR